MDEKTFESQGFGSSSSLSPGSDRLTPAPILPVTSIGKGKSVLAGRPLPWSLSSLRSFGAAPQASRSHSVLDTVILLRLHLSSSTSSLPAPTPPDGQLPL